MGISWIQTTWIGVYLIFIIFSCQGHFDPRQPDSPHTRQLFASNDNVLVGHNQNIDDHTPIILWWTDRLFMEKGLSLTESCGKYNCYKTNDRRYLYHPNTRALYFYGTDIETEDLPLPRGKTHEWALYHEESPMNNYMLSHGAMIQLFNYTATFKRESDYPLSSQNILSLDYLTKRKPLSVAAKNQYKFKHDIASVLYVQSHCDVPSDRDRYVKELKKYIKVDSVGACLNNKQIKKGLEDPVESMESPKFLDYISNYKFHLAFENAICNDYMTEKLFRTLHVGSVPIYYGSPLAQDWMPNNHSIIMVKDFESPEKLASFISSIDNDDVKYEKYLSYKIDGITNPYLRDQVKKRKWFANYFGEYDTLSGFECYVCDKITERMQNEREHQRNKEVNILPPKHATSSHLSCPQPYTSIGHPDDYPTSDSWRDSFWIEDYWSGFDKARAIQKMLEVNETDPSTFKKYWEEIFTK